MEQSERCYAARGGFKKPPKEVKVGRSIPVRARLDVHSVTSIREVQETFEAIFQLTLEWTDPTLRVYWPRTSQKLEGEELRRFMDGIGPEERKVFNQTLRTCKTTLRLRSGRCFPGVVVDRESDRSSVTLVDLSGLLSKEELVAWEAGERDLSTEELMALWSTSSEPGAVQTRMGVPNSDVMGYADFNHVISENLQAEIPTERGGMRDQLGCVPRLTVENATEVPEIWTDSMRLMRLSEEGALILWKRKYGATLSESMELNRFPLDRQVLRIKITAEEPFEVFHFPDEGPMAPQGSGWLSELPEEWDIPLEFRSDRKVLVFAEPLVDRMETRGVYNPRDDAEQQRPHETDAILRPDTPSRRPGPLKSFSQQSKMVMYLHVERNPSFYFWNVVFPILLINGVSFIAVWIHPFDDSRANLQVTFLLTLVAYKYTLSSWLPRKSYLTLLDKYVLMSFALQVLFIAENTIFLWDCDPDSKKSPAFPIVSKTFGRIGRVLLRASKRMPVQEDLAGGEEHDEEQQMLKREACYNHRKDLDWGIFTYAFLLWIALHIVIFLMWVLALHNKERWAKWLCLPIRDPWEDIYDANLVPEPTRKRLAQRRHPEAVEWRLQVESMNGATLSGLLMKQKREDVLVVFYAPWCKRCRKLVYGEEEGHPRDAPLEQLSSSLAPVKVVRYDIHAHREGIPKEFLNQATGGEGIEAPPPPRGHPEGATAGTPEGNEAWRSEHQNWQPLNEIGLPPPISASGRLGGGALDFEHIPAAYLVRASGDKQRADPPPLSPGSSTEEDFLAEWIRTVDAARVNPPASTTGSSTEEDVWITNSSTASSTGFFSSTAGSSSSGQTTKRCGSV